MDYCLYCRESTHWTLLSAIMRKSKTFICPHCGKEQDVEYEYWKNYPDD